MWISKSKFGQLKSKLEAQESEIKSQKALLGDKEEEIYSWRNRYSDMFTNRLQAMFADSRELKAKSKELKEANEALKTEIEKYKNLYADELQKRLELAEKVMEMEGKK